MSQNIQNTQNNFEWKVANRLLSVTPTCRLVATELVSDVAGEMKFC